MQYRTKFSILILITLFGLQLSAQNQIKISKKFDWSSANVLVNPLTDKYLNIYSIEEGKSNIIHPQVPNYTLRYELSSLSKVNIEIINPIYTDIVLSDPKTIAFLKNDIEIRSFVTQERDKYYASINFIPVIKSGNQFLKLESCDIIMTITPTAPSVNRRPPNTTESVLASGDIYKMKVSNTGMYKLSYSFLKNDLNLNIDQLDPRNISIYGNEGGVLPQAISQTRTDDLSELSIKIVGEEDGSFDSQDYILLYAQGADTWKTDQSLASLSYQKNIYDNANYIYLKVNSTNGKRVLSQGDTNFQAAYNTDSYDHFIRYEEDRTNLLGQYASTQGSGQLWFGPSFTNERTQDFSSFFNVDQVVANSNANLIITFAGRSSSTSQFKVSVNNQSWSRNISSVDVDEIEATYANYRSVNEEFILSGDNPNIVVEYPPSSASSEGWLDYIQLQLRRNIVLGSNPLNFRDLSSAEYNSVELNIRGQNNIKVWNVSSLDNILEMKAEINGNQATIKLQNNQTIPEFLAFTDNSNFFTPEFDQKLANQNLHGISNADMLIIYYKDFEEAAVKLRNHRSEFSNINVEAVEVSLIYNEFSSGRVDPSAIRDFIKMIYDRNPNFKYVLLLGDGSYDFKGIVPGLQYQSFVPVYETKESLDPIDAFPSDDYYGLLSDQDGANLVGGLEVSVGRIPAKTLNEANIVVNKIINYQTNRETLGAWRMRNQFTSDDEDGNLHYRQSESIALKLEQNHPEVNIKKVHIDAFVQESTPGGERYPEATEALNSNVENGILILNYLGHGGPKGWAQERILQVNDLINMNNFNKLALFITATCSFTGYDDPGLVSAGENAILSPSGAAIALMTTTRSVYANENKRLTQSVFDTIYTQNQGIYQTIGETILRGKNNEGQDTLSVNARKFALIGDPSMTLSLPKYNINVTELNGSPVGTTMDTIGALQKVSVKGVVTDYTGSIVENFNGILNPTIFDKKSKISTLANDERSQVASFEVFKNVIFKGQVSVTNGQWEFSFIVPKDIDYSYGPGKMSFYASDGISIDAGGYYNQFIVGGTFAQAISDNNGPEIDLFIDTESFVSGETTDENPKLIVILRDDNGINVSGTSIGHDLTAILDDNTQNKYVLNEYYEANLDDYTGGRVEYNLSELELGPHQIKVKAFDIANNSSEAVIDFIVVDNNNGALAHVLNYPNPFTTKTNFTFEHDFPNSSVDVLVNIFTVSGKLVKTIQTTTVSKGTRVDDVEWNGNDDYESPLAKGVYLYKIQISDNSSNEIRESSIEKLVILK